MTLNNPLTYFSATPATVHLEVLFTQDVLTCAFVATLASRFFTHFATNGEVCEERVTAREACHQQYSLFVVYPVYATEHAFLTSEKSYFQI